jgi:fatty-acyl-CoA synthase
MRGLAPSDGKTMGELQIRGALSIRISKPIIKKILPPMVGFKTGDVSTIDPDGYMEIKDRTKDLIKVVANGFLALH